MDLEKFERKRTLRRTDSSYEVDPQSRPNVKFLCVSATGAGIIVLIILYLAGAPFILNLAGGATSPSNNDDDTRQGSTSKVPPPVFPAPTRGPTTTNGGIIAATRVPTMTTTADLVRQPSREPSTLSPLAFVPSVVSSFGALKVSGRELRSGLLDVPLQLAGMSLFWSNTRWGGEQYYSREVIEELVKKWRVSIVRCAMGVEDRGGYVFDANANENRVRKVVEAAIAFDIYVIIDFHSHHAELYIEEAKEFFKAMAEDYGSYPNVIFEIYNEPISTDWPAIKTYAEEVVPIIREFSENLILLGTPTYSQDLDVVAESPVSFDDNIAYVLHFYAGTHSDELRAKAQVAIDADLCVFVSEWGSVDADGDGRVASQSVSRWISFLDDNNISHLNWALNVKDEGASVLLPSTDQKDLPWTYPNDLTASGRLVFDILQDAADKRQARTPTATPTLNPTTKPTTRSPTSSKPTTRSPTTSSPTTLRPTLSKATFEPTAMPAFTLTPTSTGAPTPAPTVGPILTRR